MADEEIVRIGEPYTIGSERFEPRDDQTFDEVGYALVKSDSGGSTSIGEGYDPASITASHRILPLPGYVEVTHLETGKTILVRLNDRGPMAKDRVIALSPGAAQALGATGGSLPVRVRRVNPPISERAVLRMGQAAPDRLDTPPALLSALRRKMKESGQAAPRQTADLPVTVTPAGAKPASKVVARPATKSSVPAGVGADFDAPSAATSVSRPAPRQVARAPVRTSRPVPAPAKTGNDRFIVEGDGVRSVPPQEVSNEEDAPAPVRAAAPVRSATSPASASQSVGYGVQLAAFSDEGRARHLAQLVRGKLIRSGKIWRVAIGPFATEEMARAALSDARSKGYRDARITR